MFSEQPMSEMRKLHIHSVLKTTDVWKESYTYTVLWKQPMSEMRKNLHKQSVLKTTDVWKESYTYKVFWKQPMSEMWESCT